MFIWRLSNHPVKDLKFSFLKFKKYRVRRFAPRLVCVLHKFPHGERFFSLYGKNLSPCGKFNDIDAKHQQKSASLPVRKEKSLAVRELVQDTYQARSEAANTILFNH
jgi:hypothetical protein